MESWIRSAGWLVCMAVAPWPCRVGRRRTPGTGRRDQARPHHPARHRQDRATGWWPSANAVSCCTRTTTAKTWTARPTPVTRTLTGVAFKDQQTGVAVGHGGSVVRTEDARRDLEPGAGGRGRHRFAARRPASRRRSLHRLRRVRPVFRFDRCRPDLDSGARSSVGVHRRRGTRRAAADKKSGIPRRRLRSSHLPGDPGRLDPAAGRGIRNACAIRRRRRELDAPRHRRTRAPGSARSRSTTAACWCSACAATSSARADLGATWQKVPLGTTASLMGGAQLADGRILLVGNTGLLALSTRRRPDARTALVAGRSKGFAAGRRGRRTAARWSGEGGVSAARPRVADRSSR